MNTVAHLQGSTRGPLVRMLNSKFFFILDQVYLWKYVFKLGNLSELWGDLRWEDEKAKDEDFRSNWSKQTTTKKIWVSKGEAQVRDKGWILESLKGGE